MLSASSARSVGSASASRAAMAASRRSAFAGAAFRRSRGPARQLLEARDRRALLLGGEDLVPRRHAVGPEGAEPKKLPFHVASASAVPPRGRQAHEEGSGS